MWNKSIVMYRLNSVFYRFANILVFFFSQFSLYHIHFAFKLNIRSNWGGKMMENNRAERNLNRKKEKENNFVNGTIFLKEL